MARRGYSVQLEKHQGVAHTQVASGREGIAESHPATRLPARLALVDGVTAWLRPVGVQRGTYASGQLTFNG
jgi:hypothetical protein